MSDITKCTGEGCPMRGTCRRFTDKESIRQSYFVEPPFKVKNSTIYSCEMYWGQTQDHIFNFLKSIT